MGAISFPPRSHTFNELHGTSQTPLYVPSARPGPDPGDKPQAILVPRIEVRGWQQYYGSFYRSALHGLLSRINAYLLRWIRRKYERLRPFTKAKACWRRVTVRCPRLFAHWRLSLI